MRKGAGLESGLRGEGERGKISPALSLKPNLWAKTSTVLGLIMSVVCFPVNLAHTVLSVDHFSGQTSKETES